MLGIGDQFGIARGIHDVIAKPLLPQDMQGATAQAAAVPARLARPACSPPDFETVFKPVPAVAVTATHQVQHSQVKQRVRIVGQHPQGATIGGDSLLCSA